MDFNTFVRRPFVIEAVEITNDNIEAIAAYVGDLRMKPNGVPFIEVDKRRVPNVYRVFPGFFMTTMETDRGAKIRCYSPKAFASQFVESTYENLAWVDHMTPSAVEDDTISNVIGVDMAPAEDGEIVGVIHTSDGKVIGEITEDGFEKINPAPVD